MCVLGLAYKFACVGEIHHTEVRKQLSSRIEGEAGVIVYLCVCSVPLTPVRVPEKDSLLTGSSHNVNPLAVWRSRPDVLTPIAEPCR